MGLVVSCCALGALADDVVTAKASNNMATVEDDIKFQEELVDDMRDSIAILDGKIERLKLQLDSINAIAKDLKGQINDLQKLRKEQEKGIKASEKTRLEHVETRDILIYQNEVLPVLEEQFDKIEVERALAQFNKMETKDVIKRKELVSNYGKYYKEIRDMLEKQKRTFEQQRWSVQGADSEAYKTFQKAFKGVGYYKVFDKGQKNPNHPTIPYLDEVMLQIQSLMRSGFNNKQLYDNVLNMLY